MIRNTVGSVILAAAIALIAWDLVTTIQLQTTVVAMDATLRTGFLPRVEILERTTRSLYDDQYSNLLEFHNLEIRIIDLEKEYEDE